MDLKLKIPPALVFVACAILMWGIDWVFPVDWLSISSRTWLAAAVAVAGGLLGALGVGTFYQHSTTVNPHKPESTAMLVESGVYQYSRNPMYLGLLLVLAAVGVYLGNPVTAVVLPLFVWDMNRFQIRPEEEVMTKKFGKTYRQYQSKVGRWI